MQIKELRGLVQSVPLVVFLSDGRTFQVSHPDYLFVPPIGGLFVIVDQDGTWHHLAVDQVTGVKSREIEK